MTTQFIRRNASPVRSSVRKFVRLRGWASRSNFGKSLVENKHPKLPGYPSLSYVGTEYEVSRTIALGLVFFILPLVLSINRN